MIFMVKNHTIIRMRIRHIKRKLTLGLASILIRHKAERLFMRRSFRVIMDSGMTLEFILRPR